MSSPEQENSLNNQRQKLQKNIVIEIQRENGEIEKKELDRLPLTSRQTEKGKIPIPQVIKWSELQKELSQIFDCQPPNIISVTYKYPNYS